VTFVTLRGGCSKKLAPVKVKGPIRVKTGKAQTEHMFSGSPPLADINESRQHFRIVQERL
jgi:hypothetical protein